ncbi:hypothetical protein OSB04_031779 [Centaurea solstitialis]|uniref:Starch synthase catalytic domain-containing protein n=1 Tax=Centaurea solstitialis TaxID=347529 RepID=A0AA38W8F5_9ASTR|nr:hypothetical protein OSB04_031779 [Centaurea solstitialis]
MGHDQDQETNEPVLQSTDPDHRSEDLLKTLNGASSWAEDQQDCSIGNLSLVSSAVQLGKRSEEQSGAGLELFGHTIAAETAATTDATVAAVGLMATVSRWDFVTRSSTYANNGVVAISSSSVNKREVKKVKASCLSVVAKRQVYNAMLIGKKSTRKVIVCGMNLVFVGAEVGPWSKTGGLGDVLGGLPPAMAV